MILLTFIDPISIIYAYSIPTVLIYHSASIVNVLGHMHGYRNFETQDKSTNSWLASILTLGDGWHNNHHSNPRAWSLHHNWWEFDVAAIVIKVIRK